MRKFLKGAIVGALVLVGGMSVAPLEASAMPVAGMTANGAEVGAAPAPEVETIYWRRGWRRPGWRYGYGWRRPYGWGWRRPYHRRFYRW